MAENLKTNQTQPPVNSPGVSPWEGSLEGRDQALEEIVVNFVMLTSTGNFAHPEAAPVFQGMQNCLTQLLALALGSEWVAEHEASIDTQLKARAQDLKMGVESAMDKPN